MNYSRIIILLFAVLFLGLNTADAQCEKMKKKRIYQLLGAAEFDNYRSTAIKTYDNTLKEEYQINLFRGVVYKLIFDVANMPEGVIINLHDIGNKKGPGKYELIFSSETATKTAHDTYEVTMEFPLKKLMVSYDVINNTKPGCVSFVLGYYFKNRIK